MGEQLTANQNLSSHDSGELFIQNNDAWVLLIFVLTVANLFNVS